MPLHTIDRQASSVVVSKSDQEAATRGRTLIEIVLVESVAIILVAISPLWSIVVFALVPSNFELIAGVQSAADAMRAELRPVLRI
jgi:hypothetical protein